MASQNIGRWAATAAALGLVAAQAWAQTSAPPPASRGMEGTSPGRGSAPGAVTPGGARDFASRDFGRREFQRSCASCHGATGKGDGVLVEHLRRSPPDLTQLSRRNQGVFPFQRLYEVIEGGGLAAHGTRDMPVWGTQYRIEDAEYHGDAMTAYDPEALARSRILSLLEYLNRIQVR